MALSNPALPYGLRDVKLKPVAADGTVGAAVDLPVSRTFTFADAESFDDLTGDDATVASHGQGPLVTWDLEAGGISFAAYKVLAGGAIVNTGVSPNAVSTYTKLTTDSRPYFQVEGQAISDSGGDMHCIVYRCKATGDLTGSFVGNQFMLTACTGKGYGDIVGASPTGKLYVFVQNETITAIT